MLSSTPISGGALSGSPAEVYVSLVGVSVLVYTGTAVGGNQTINISITDLWVCIEPVGSTGCTEIRPI